MGQTLTHGIYLPDEGERNCYNGLASNWSILDGAVGTVAEHSTQIAGKAPLVHTHTKADITDFPAYGTTAGTICEGNDSRLSDARTPVAHTHTKSDVTDLFNSANTWSALNSYNQSIQITANFNIGAAPSSEISGGFNFGNGTTNIGNVTARINSSGATYSRLCIGNKFTNGALDPNGTWKYVELQVGLRANGDRFIYTDGLWRNSLTPYDSNVSIGDSTHQWNNLYAKRVNTQSVNGTNPGALSLPKEEYSDVDISAQGLNWNLTGSSDNSYTPNRDGWLEIWVKKISLPTAYISIGNAYVRQVSEATVFNFACVTCPVRNGQTYTVRILADECHVRIMKAEGNV